MNTAEVLTKYKAMHEYCKAQGWHVDGLDDVEGRVVLVPGAYKELTLLYDAEMADCPPNWIYGISEDSDGEKIELSEDKQAGEIHLTIYRRLNEHGGATLKAIVSRNDQLLGLTSDLNSSAESMGLRAPRPDFEEMMQEAREVFTFQGKPKLSRHSGRTLLAALVNKHLLK